MPLLAETVAPVTESPAVLPAPAVKTVVRSDAKSGRLVRTVVAPPVPRMAPAELTEMVDRISGREGVEAPLVHSVIQAESNYNPGAVSPKGAQGIMQLIPSTARRFGVANAFDAEDNITGGVRYLRFLLDYYHGDYTKSIAAYNAGEAAVDKFHGVPPYAETLGYVRTVARHLTAERQNATTAKARAATAAAPVSDAGPRHIEAELGADGLVYYKTP
jgi:hypothetical protein